MLLFFVIVTLFFFVALHHAMAHISECRVKKLSWVLFGVIILVELFLLCAFTGIEPPEIDGGHLYLKAKELINPGQAGNDHLYFQIYPNNIPIMLIRYLFYLCTPFQSSHALFIFDHVLCMVALNLGIFFSWKIVKQLLGGRMGLVFLFLILTCAPVFFYTLYFYSDTLMIMMPPLLIFVVMCYERSGRVFDAAMLCFIFAAGCVIRQNLILFLPALMIYLCFRSQFKRALVLMAGILTVLFFLQMAVADFAGHINIQANSKTKMPVTHWTMLGLSEQGRYNLRDFRLTYQQPTQAAKKAVNVREIKRRLASKSIGELTYLWAVKAFRVYADGSLGYYWYLGNTTDHSLLYDYFIGNQRQLLLFMIQIGHCVHLLLLFYAALLVRASRKVDPSLFLLIMLFGNFLFYIFLWEAEPRYALLFFFPLLIADCYGLKALASFLSRHNQLRILKMSISTQQMAHFLFLLLLCISAAHINQLTRESDVQYRYAVNQNQSKGSEYARVSDASSVQQTFYANRSFDHISLGKAGARGTAVYRLMIRSQSGPGQSAVKTFTAQELEKGELSEIKLNHPLAAATNYTMILSKLTGNDSDYLDLPIHGKGLFEQRDLYPEGSLFQNGRQKSGQDLQFRVYHKEIRAYLTVPVFVLLISVPLVMIIFFADVYRESETAEDVSGGPAIFRYDRQKN
ncbi:glycosyltransferase family 39 protein [Sporolactobacillus sp. CPB3-1]|uniref:Glycosyltransferase family 39 protein n=1 Tax=Sporolactobacillus mangiferae TaxID=2940498 RepID=A0ABT0MAW2_9BACL|nr:glycosyltransferase family 39 protein [Sporolactobacillus mangiferae]MCL1631808.1 glycosyltransferase family 39 protein [Sporolactobacillus mangiferae]